MCAVILGLCGMVLPERYTGKIGYQIRTSPHYGRCNHENFDILYELPLTEKFDGKVREIAPDIYHLDRGQVLTIDDQKIFVMGGARSHDRENRIEHISWWEQEMPTSAEMERAIEALDKCGGKSIMLLHIVLQKAYRKWCVVGMKTTLL